MDSSRSDSRGHLRSGGKGKGPYRGPPTRGENYKPVCSIPAKFETILFKGPRESKGFGSEGRRFGSSETDNPGPGTYSAPASAIAVSTESSSKKGFGALTSHAPRFKQRLCYTGPGPGAYEQHLAMAGAGLPTTASPSSSFHPKVVQGRPVMKEQVMPGPGAYNPVETRQGTKLDMLAASNSHKSAFKTPSRKLEYLHRDPEVPGPCSYTVSDAWNVSGKGQGGASGRGGTRSCTSSFAPKSTTSLLSMPSVMFLDSPDAPDASREKASGGPGPGSYEIFDHKSVSSAAAKAAVKPSPAFIQPEYIDRFAQPLASTPPLPSEDVFTVGRDQGGGAKPGIDLAASRAPGVSAPFKSRSAAHGDYDIHEIARAPGPCYYSPSLPTQRKSFHLNARKAYLPGKS